MTTLLAIDPGVHAQACAVYRAGVLVEALMRVMLELPSEWADLDTSPTTVLVERPEYQGKRSDQARLSDLLALSWHGATYAAYIAGATGAELATRTPSQWKGSAPKPIVHAALWSVLAEQERALLGGAKTLAAIERALERGAAKRWPPGQHFYPKSFTMHNILDAAAMGAVYIKRIEKP